jgi:hypothetical protein
MKMADQTTTKSMGLIRILKIYVHNIPYITLFTMLQNSVVDFSCSMLLGRPWLKDVKVAHDLGNNIVTIQETIRTITVTKHLRGEVRRPKVLQCYNYQNGIIDEKYIFVIKQELFSIGIISLLNTIQSIKTINMEVMDASVKTSNVELKSRIQIIEQKTNGNKYEPKVALEDKVYPKTYYSHQLRSVVVDETLEKIKAQEW